VTFEVRRYTPEDSTAWDELVERSRTGHFLFRRGYMDYHADRFEDHSLLVLSGARIAAALPANIDGDQLVSHGGLTFGGVITDASMSTRRMLEAFGALVGHARSAGVRTILYKAVPHVYQRTPADEDLYALWRAGATLSRRDVASVIDLQARLPYTKGRKADMKVAERSGVEVAASDDFGAFMDLQSQVLQSRHDAEPVHSADELAMLAARFPQEIRLHVATIGERLVAGVVTYETAVVAHTQYIAVGEEGRETHALDKIVDTLIRSYGGRKRWFDFGTSMLDSSRALNEALIRNKESYGARAVVYDHYLVDLGT
jgi:hypothetical protein